MFLCNRQDSAIPCGVTIVDDLGRKDRKMLTTLAHLELMMLFDECNITYSRKKTRRKGSGNFFYLKYIIISVVMSEAVSF